MKRGLKRALSLVIAVAMVIGSVSYISVTANAKEEFPTHYDLREKGVVTPVKFQNPWGSCWAFAGIAASEISILSKLGIANEEYKATHDGQNFDLSELHLTWYGLRAITEKTAPETFDFDNDLYDAGGDMEVWAHDYMPAYTSTNEFTVNAAPTKESLKEGQYKYGVAVVNPGESFYYSDGRWLDWKDAISMIKEMQPEVSNYELDNFSIKAYMVATSEVMYRLYNPNSGEHFYTKSAVEKDNLINEGWGYEGVGWTAPASSDTPVYRLYNPNSGEHFYTTKEGERDYLTPLGWRYEGIGWYSADEDAVPVYRLYNPNATGIYEAGAHFYTMKEEERDYLDEIGWNYEGIAWYGESEYMTYEEFKSLSNEEQIEVFNKMTGEQIYVLVAESDESWVVDNYDLITPENAKETIVLFENNGDLHFNLAWPCYGGFKPESIESIGELRGTLDVSRDGGDGGYSMSYGRNADGSYPNDSERSVPKTSATVRTGTLDVDRYNETARIVTNG